MRIVTQGPVLNIGGVELPSSAVATLKDHSLVPGGPQLPYDVEIEIKLQDGEPPRCVRLSASSRADGQAVTSDGLRAIPLAAMVERVMVGVALEVGREAPQSFHSQPDWDAYRRWRVPEGGRRELSEEHLTAVADVYSLALALRQNPLEVVADVFSASSSTAARWVRGARDHGVLAAETMRQRAKERE